MPAEEDDPAPAATVTVCENGPLLVRGDFALLTQDGRVIDPGRPTIALCRCGKSAVKPFCDGTHKLVRAGPGGTSDVPDAGDAGQAMIR